MTTYAWPPTWAPARFEAQLVPNVRTFMSPYGGATQTLDLLGEKWRFMLEMNPKTDAQAAEIEAFITRLRGGANRVTMWHMRRPTPRGTISGSPTLSGNLTQGASSVAIASAGAGATVLAGDLLGAGGMILQAAADATADGGGNITVQLANRPRALVSSGASVTWTKPSADFVLSAPGGAPMRYDYDGPSPVALEFMEAW